jgi:hypothetical protein
VGPLQPVTVHDRYDGGHRDGYEESHDATQFNAGQDGDDNREGVEVETTTDETRVDRVIVEHTE